MTPTLIGLTGRAGSDNLDALRHSGLGFVVVGHNARANLTDTAR